MNITRFERVQGIHGPFWSAVVDIDGHTLSLSRYDCETTWLADSHYGPDAYPYFAHGPGSRCCLKQAVLEDSELAGLLAVRLQQELASAGG